MIRNWRRLLGRTACSLGLLLAAQLAYAAEMCVSALGMEAPALGVAAQERCLSASPERDACIANPHRIDASVSMPTPLRPDSQPSADAPCYVRGISLATVQPRLATGLAPGSRSPFHILFRRYLS